jgi:hypothetical protein
MIEEQTNDDEDGEDDKEKALIETCDNHVRRAKSVCEYKEPPHASHQSFEDGCRHSHPR